METTIELANKADLASILVLAQACHLPTAGVEEHLATALVARDQGQVVGSGELELYGECALLRSYAVAPQMRGRGIGQRLANAALDMARRPGVRSVYLLTETASEFFPRFGFEPIDRALVPPSVKASAEFTSACLESAVVMVAKL